MIVDEESGEEEEEEDEIVLENGPTPTPQEIRSRFLDGWVAKGPLQFLVARQEFRQTIVPSSRMDELIKYDLQGWVWRVRRPGAGVRRVPGKRSGVCCQQHSGSDVVRFLFSLIQLFLTQHVTSSIVEDLYYARSFIRILMLVGVAPSYVVWSTSNLHLSAVRRFTDSCAASDQRQTSFEILMIM